MNLNSLFMTTKQTAVVLTTVCIALLLVSGLAVVSAQISPVAARPTNVKAAKVAPTQENLAVINSGTTDVASLDSINKRNIKRLSSSSLGRNVVCKGDVNFDKRIDAADIDPFSMVVQYPEFIKKYHPAMFWRADMDDNGAIDETDVNLFVDVLTGRSRPKCIAPDSTNTEKLKRLPSVTARNAMGCKGDINADNRVNFADIDPFRMVLDYPQFIKSYHPDIFWRADINSDGQVNSYDVNPFVALLTGANPTQACN